MAFVVDTVSDSHGNGGLYDPDSCVLRMSMSHSSSAGSALPVGESLIPVQILLGSFTLCISLQILWQRTFPNLDFNRSFSQRKQFLSHYCIIWHMFSLPSVDVWSR